MFKPSNYLQESLNEHPQVRRNIIGALIGYINADQAFETNDFDNAIQYALQHGISRNDLFQPYDTSKNKIDNNRSNWDESYYALTKVRLKANFCQERIDHCKEVAHYLYPNGFKNQKAASTPNERTSSNPMTQQKGSDNVRKKAQEQQYSHRTPSAPETPSSSKTRIAVLVVCLVVLILGIYWILKK